MKAEPTGICGAASDRTQALVGARSADAVVRNIVAVAAAALLAWGGVSRAQPAAAATQTLRTPQEQSGPATASAPSDGLSELDAMTFSCPKAALNAAARAAAMVRSQGTYQFAYFNIVTDAHHAAYEVHFKSNYEGEADLKYCVAIYCQQGWDPKTTRASVTLIVNGKQRMDAAAHGASCRAAPATVKRPVTRQGK